MGKGQPVQIIPVLDIMGGEVVKACGGEREKYSPITSPLLSSSDPIRMVERFIELFGFATFYIADLDAIMGKGSNRECIAKLLKLFDCEFIVDGGYKKLSDCEFIVEGAYKDLDDTKDNPGLTHVIATETFIDWNTGGSLKNVVVSIDTCKGDLVSPFPRMTTEQVLERARVLGAKRFFHIRLEAVGEGVFDSRFWITPAAGEKWYTGGGVKGPKDLQKIREVGYVGALVSTALHNGDLP